ncbi:DUF1007 family protein [Pasteurellaceae bacterium USgator11]|nr:DUF1007 family protein [Pasteurellaceae bacterium UScroc12]TNG98209.1 DUF1007 family protein [Pasteurellaceae bacterium USgator41]TNH00316.1 DUF1007 family protein [Pasteurellaceae bacterium UScroc31]TNH01859.1 DUF1007 family protein [Pasteurellaceae bacterium USgator11]
MRQVRSLILLCIGLFSFHSGWAHPHAFIDMQTQFLIKDQQLIGLRMAWLFDEAASSELIYDIQISQNPAETKRQISDSIMQNIVNQHYFSYFYDQRQQPLKYTSKPDQYQLNVIGNHILFSFNFYLSQAQPIHNFHGTLSSYDPSYYVAMTYPQAPARTIADYPQCQVTLQTPNVDQKIKDYAASLDKSQKDDDMTLGALFAQQVVLSCQ